MDDDSNDQFVNRSLKDARLHPFVDRSNAAARENVEQMAGYGNDPLDPTPIALQLSHIVPSVPLDALADNLQREGTIGEMHAILNGLSLDEGDRKPAANISQAPPNAIVHARGKNSRIGSGDSLGSEDDAWLWTVHDVQEKKPVFLSDLKKDLSWRSKESSSSVVSDDDEEDVSSEDDDRIQQLRRKAGAPFIGSASDDSLRGAAFASGPVAAAPAAVASSSSVAAARTPSKLHPSELDEHGNLRKFRARAHNKDQWDARFVELQTFKVQFGHCQVPYMWPPNKALAQWVKRQRYQKKLADEGRHNTMTPARQAALNQLGFAWNSHDAAWEERFADLVKYREQNGHCRVPGSYNANRPLASWVKSQRRQYRLFQSGNSSKLTPERIARMDRLGFPWNADGGPSLSGGSAQSQGSGGSRNRKAVRKRSDGSSGEDFDDIFDDDDDHYNRKPSPPKRSKTF